METPSTPMRPIEVSTPMAPERPKPRKRYLSTSSDDEQFPPTKTPQEEDEEISQIWQSLLDSISIPNSIMQEPAAEAVTAEEPEKCINTSIPPSPIELWNMASASNIHIQAPEALANNQPAHLTLKNLLGLSIDETQHILPRKRRGAMRGIVRATIYGILKHCLSQYLYESCIGCTIQAPGQSSHECTVWTENDISTKLRILCAKLWFQPVLHVVILIGYSLNCLALTSENVDQVLILTTEISRAINPRMYLEKIMKTTDQSFLQHVERVIKDRPYKSFLTSNNQMTTQPMRISNLKIQRLRQHMRGPKHQRTTDLEATVKPNENSNTSRGTL
ncbi:uncharacterized protein LOC134413424 [Elgaria multicarinata webbii]|uniref:uncharacterized protein LOC134413424 n=2 Tax=Elgaria multicarinata webbii TaxID=159646 RepID=UPI002FCCDFCD